MNIFENIKFYLKTLIFTEKILQNKLKFCIELIACLLFLLGSFLSIENFSSSSIYVGVESEASR